jgi:hypothetical protein
VTLLIDDSRGPIFDVSEYCSGGLIVRTDRRGAGSVGALNCISFSCCAMTSFSRSCCSSDKLLAESSIDMVESLCCDAFDGRPRRFVDGGLFSTLDMLTLDAMDATEDARENRPLTRGGCFFLGRPPFEVVDDATDASESTEIKMFFTIYVINAIYLFTRTFHFVTGKGSNGELSTRSAKFARWSLLWHSRTFHP